MNAANDNTAPKGPRGWWLTPPRPGLQRLISPWEYRHLRFCSGVRLGAGIVLAGVGVVTLVFGGNDWKTYGWTLGFLALAAANVSFARWELTIARSGAAYARACSHVGMGDAS